MASNGACVWENKLRWNTEYSADSVEWCPVARAPYCNVLVCGTYQLDKNGESTGKQTRLGRIYLFIIDNETKALTPIQTIDTPGILDQKWCYHTIENYPILAVVTSIGTLLLYRLIDNNGCLNLKLWIKYEIGVDLLALSLDWSTNKLISEEPLLVISDSVGYIHVVAVSEDSLQTIGKWKSHSFEAWIGAFNYWDTNVFYSGGDDCLFKSYDRRIPDVATSVNKSHDAGVTSIRSHIDIEHQLLTGSYDEKIRLWDTRKLKSCLNEINVNGGVWRLKWHPYKSNTVLAACMYGGFRIINVANEMTVASEYLEHESIAYGADWQFHEENSLVATCSFYDCNMHISQIVNKF